MSSTQHSKGMASAMRRSLLLAMLAAVSMPVLADSYPSRPIRLLVGFAAGGTTDAIARFYAQKLSIELKTPVIVENKPGAGQIVAIRSLKASAPDGYTLYMGTGSALSQSPGVRNDLPYDPLKDFTFVGLVGTAQGVIIVNKDVPAKSLRDLVTYASKHPGQLNFGSSGIGSASHLAGEYMNKVSGMMMTHVPYKADADIVQAMYTGSVQVGIAPVQGAVTALTSGKVRALAVTGTHRVKAIPDVPSVSEAGIKGFDGLDPYTYYGMLGPAGMPDEAVRKLNEALNRVSLSPDVAAQVRDKLYAEPGTSTPQAFRKQVQDDITRWRQFSKLVSGAS
ncbi:tripartite tricarboxylate transporter substrate-binding protein [Cupriavidus sp. CV2]|uniref:Bug family tripartite tricarboxylate transporter substrate binding protein n=1 Tax=Cupriavidus ulmosensis TaxID=3065913 RepID=UPI00296AB5AC|nr:tripartite tricarboxylate transporter substrate-binding protein [Cupriavidus sp. CV2]MDW3682800.1 tripartite tricarboxylate transporter substrate-binding protein [Cupriavidus sp. CV2]